MLFNVEPDQSVTGGAWYSDQDFESEFVEVLNDQCYKYLQQKVICVCVSVCLIVSGMSDMFVAIAGVEVVGAVGCEECDVRVFERRVAIY